MHGVTMSWRWLSNWTELQTKQVREFQLSYLKILKDDAVTVLLSICQQIWKTQQWPQDCKRSVFISIPKKGSVKECSDYCINTLISHANKLMLKILQARLQQYVNWELLDAQAGFGKARGIWHQIANIHWFIEKARGIPKKYLLFLHWLC